MNEVLPQLNELLLSSVEGVSVESVEVIDTVVRVEARTTAGRAACPGCGCWSGRIHGSYLRFPRDLPTAGKFVVVSLRVRRFVCEEESCERMTFAEQVPGLTEKCVYRHRGCLRPTPPSLRSRRKRRSSTTELPSLRSFAQHLERHLDAVTAGLTLPWNSGVVEGHANRIKMLKRQMFGRAGSELLRKRVLLA